MFNDVMWKDVSKFVLDEDILVYFKLFVGLIKDVNFDRYDLKVRIDMFIFGLIGIVFLLNIIFDYLWVKVNLMVS